MSHRHTHDRRIAIIGPVYPYKGGIALHTTELAHRLQKQGYRVQVISWQHQYPRLLYKGEQRLKNEPPEIPPFSATTYPLNWYNPLGWWQVGKRLQAYDDVIIVFFVPQIQGFIGLVISWSLGRVGQRPRVIALCHNVLPHESRPGDKLFARLFLRHVDSVLVHSDAQAKLARGLTHKPVHVATMAPHLPATARDTRQHNRHSTLRHHVLFFGLVRPYKGVDILLRALVEVPGVSVTIAGELWGNMKEELHDLVRQLGLGDRVTFIEGYIPSQDLPELFAAADALVLPYRSSTGTQNVVMGFAYGLPVIATRVGTNAQTVKDEVDGLLCRPEDPADLARALNHLYDDGVARKLQKNVQPPTFTADWQAYIQTLLHD